MNLSQQNNVNSLVSFKFLRSLASFCDYSGLIHQSGDEWLTFRSCRLRSRFLLKPQNQTGFPLFRRVNIILISSKLVEVLAKLLVALPYSVNSTTQVTLDSGVTSRQ